MKRLTENDWLRVVPPGGRVFISGGAAVPLALVESMLSQASHFKDVELVHIHGLGETPWIDPRYEGVLRTNSFYLSPALRLAVERGQADYTPCAMSEVPGLFKKGPLPLDVALIQVSPPDREDWCSLGVSVDVVKSAVTSAQWVIAQVNPQMPRIEGKARISTRQIDYFMEHSAELPETIPGHFTERHERIGRYAAQLVEDGATLQVGLGNSPEAVVRALHQHRQLGIHTGMLNDALMDLVLGGAVDHSAKNYRPGKMIASHVLGSAKLYQFAGECTELELHPSDWVNDPQRIARNDRMVAINGARQIDLTGQVVRDSSGHHFHGGIGALQDFIRGAGRSKGGCPIIVLPSTEDAGGQSRIVAGLESGSGVCTGRGDVHHVVTEYGVASLHGRSIRERVARMVEIAHPDRRETLLADAHNRGWLPKFFTMPRFQNEAGKIESAWVSFRGRRLFLRPLHPSDMRGLQEFFYSHDEETVRLRYGFVKSEMTGESAYKLAAVDPQKDRALGFFRENQGRQELRAVGRYFMDTSEKSAEVAFVVHEESRQLGVARFLLGELASTAAGRGITEFWASVLPENHAMAALFRSVGGLKDEEGDFRMSTQQILDLKSDFCARKGILKTD